MKTNGKVIEILPIATGEGKNGTWKSQDYVIEQEGQYAKKVCFNVFGEKIDEYKIQLNSQVEVEFDIESREYNGRWYTTIKAWKVTTQGEVANVPSTPRIPGAPTPTVGSDLPF